MHCHRHGGSGSGSIQSTDAYKQKLRAMRAGRTECVEEVGSLALPEKGDWEEWARFPHGAGDLACYARLFQRTADERNALHGD